MRVRNCWFAVLFESHANNPKLMTGLGRFRNLGPRCLGKTFLPKSQEEMKEDKPYEGVISRINPDTF